MPSGHILPLEIQPGTVGGLDDGWCSNGYHVPPALGVGQSLKVAGRRNYDAEVWGTSVGPRLHR
jgi:hypothetical protein